MRTKIKNNEMNFFMEILIIIILIINLIIIFFVDINYILYKLIK